VILLFGTIERKRRQASPAMALLAFTSAYVLVWLGFSLAATALQWALHAAALASPMMAMANPLVAAAVLVLAGLYQFTPLKRACLRNCRSPLDFITRHWKEGPFMTGMRHGLYCLGCCWMLMALLFVGGSMNLVWIAAITALILVEKLLPRGEWASRASGAALAAWGIWVAAMQLMGDAHRMAM
jgi:predicted metal-binding membrane protein